MTTPATASAPAPQSAPPGAGGYGLRQRTGLVLGPSLFLLVLLTSPPAGMEPLAWRTAAVGLLMATWWITEAIPIPATSLLPLALFPMLGVAAIGPAAAPYANPVIFLFMGGFMIAEAFQRWGLHRRIALNIIRALGTNPVNLVAGFMLASALLSMWVSNTATVVMMLPIGISVVDLVIRRYGEEARQSNFALSLMLGIAYAASIGGLATLIGSPPNALLAGFMAETYGVTVTFLQWMSIGVPLVVVTLPIAWVLLTRVVYPIRLQRIPGGREMIDEEMRGLGSITRPEVLVGAVTVLTAAAWVFQPLLARAVPQVSDAGIAISGALLMFILPVSLRHGVFLLDWASARRLPWDVLVLFGGGLSLAAAVTATGLAGWIGVSLAAVGTWNVFLIMLSVTAVVIFLTEMTSNTATAAAFLPIVASLAVGMGRDPLLLAVPAALAATCAFMLPVATPPNAIVYGTGYVTIPQMVRAGLWLNLLFVFAITLFAYVLVEAVFL
jgi:solute carrier family 13 (sodium-dependent dicarboxylate transporter), member 2/3/5